MVKEQLAFFIRQFTYTLTGGLYYEYAAYFVVNLIHFLIYSFFILFPLFFILVCFWFWQNVDHNNTWCTDYSLNTHHHHSYMMLLLAEKHGFNIDHLNVDFPIINSNDFIIKLFHHLSSYKIVENTHHPLTKCNFFLFTNYHLYIPKTIIYK